MGLVEDIIALGSEAPAVVSGLLKVVRTVGPVLPTVKAVVDDPAFPQVIARIKTLNELEKSQVRPTAPRVPGAPRPPAAPVGIGLNRAVPILDAVIYARRNPWAPWVAGGLALLIIGGVGYGLGKRSRA